MLKKYAEFVDQELMDKLTAFTDRLSGTTIQHINSTYTGGGVAEILTSLVPAMSSLGIDAQWDVLRAEGRFYETTKAFHNAFHGEKLDFTEQMREIYLETSRANLGIVNPDADFVVIHDQQPLGLVAGKGNTGGKWIWYCHIDPVDVDQKLWEFLGGYAAKCDAAIYHISEYAKDLGNKQFFIPPAIDPLSDKNREVSPAEQADVLERLKIPRDKPIIMQVSRFDRLKNPFGVVEAFLQIVQELPCRLIMAGGAADDDPEGRQVLEELKKMVNNHPQIMVLNLPPTSHLEINVLQRTADVIVQNSLREGFGLTVTEALWKSRPVVATPVGGLRRQVLHEQTGLLAANPAELVAGIRRLLQDKSLADRLGRNGHEHVRKNFITPVYLYHWLALMDVLKSDGPKGGR